jgi:predicted RNase H-like nuclease (RuvC/YqgF family)
MDKNAMKLCESARTQFQLMIERQEEKHERLMASMSSKLKQVLSTHISLTEHQHLLQQQAKSMQQEYDDLKSTHQEEIALIQQKHKEQTQQTTQDMIVELQKEIQPLLNQITQLKTKLNEFQAVQKNDQKGKSTSFLQ